MAKKTLKIKKKKKTPLSPEELIKRQHKKDTRIIFANVGFKSVPTAADKEFTFSGSTSDFDDVFIYQNLIILTEYTTTQSSGLSAHLKPKKILYDKILNNPTEFINFFDAKFSAFKEIRGEHYDLEQFIIKILYCSKNIIETNLKQQVPDIEYFDYPILRYFKSVTETVKQSAKYELFDFMRISPDEVGEQIYSTSNEFEEYKGSVLPHSFSNFKSGYKVVSFYIDPKSLLDKAYVLRKDGWRDDSGVYQRMISKKKINDIRKYLYTEKRVFINNIITTLPDTTKLVDTKGNSVDPTKITKTSPAIIKIPKGFGTIGLIDGQHRVFAYHEGGKFEDEISKLRLKQNLLVTGIIYPDGTTAIEKTKFEANMFLEINSTQSNAKTDLKDEIRLLLNPYETVSIAKGVINKLNEDGSLAGEFEQYFFDTDKIKTTSIVNYGLRPIVKLSGTDSFYSIWNNSDRENLLNYNDDELLKKYIQFCGTELKVYFSAVKEVMPSSLWTADKKLKGKLLTTTILNGFIICLRRLVAEKNNVFSLDYAQKRKFYIDKFQELPQFEFNKYKSSQYAHMAEDIYKIFFNQE